MIKHFLRFNESNEPDLNGKYILFDDAMWAQEAYEKLMGEVWQLREEVNHFHKMLKEKENAEENKI